MQNQMTLVLMLIGAAIIILVVLFNYWQGKRLQQPAPKPMQAGEHEINLSALNSPSDAADVADTDLLSNQPLSEQDNSESETPAEAEIATASGSETSEVSASADNVMPLHTLPSAVHRAIDGLVKFDFSPACKAETLHQLGAAPELSKPLQRFVQTEQGEWLPWAQLSADGSYTSLLLALQLVNRAGPLSEQDAAQFSDYVAQCAQQLNHQPHWLNDEPLVEAAIALDQFCLSVDKTLRLHVMHGTSGRFTGIKFKGLAETSGLVLDQGIYRYIGSQERMGYCVENMELNPFNADMLRTVVLKGVTFIMDLPHTHQCSEVLTHMIASANKMQTALGAVLVDEQLKEISEAQLQRIQQQIIHIESEMQARGIPPGSDLALRVFS